MLKETKSFHPGDLIYFEFDPDQEPYMIMQIKHEPLDQTLYKIKKDWYMAYQLRNVTKETHPEEYL